MQLNDIENAAINDRVWSCMVVFLIESDKQFVPHIESFRNYSKNYGERYAIQVITSEDVAKELRSQRRSSSESRIKRKKKRQIKSSDGSIVFSDVSSLNVRKRRAIEIKRQILNIKLDNNSESAVVQLDKKRMKKSKKGKRTARTAESSTASGGKQIKKTLHDEPNCGPNVYFILIGFNDCTLIEQLLNLHVPVTGVISYGRTEIIDFSELKIKTSNIETIDKLKQFWIDLLSMIDYSSANEMSDLVVLECEEPFMEMTTDTEVNQEPIDSGRILYDYFSNYLYTLGREYRKYIHYINSATEINFPSAQRGTSSTFLTYTKMANAIPLQYVTVEYLLHCMVEHVAENRKSNNNLKENIKKKTESCEPLIINNRNKIGKKTFNIRQIDLCEILLNIYVHMPYSKIVEYLNIADVFTVAKIKCQLDLLGDLMDLKPEDRDQLEIVTNQILFTQMCDLLMYPVQIETLANSVQYESADLESRESELIKLRQFFNCIEIENLKNYRIENNEFLLNYKMLEELNRTELLQSLQRATLKYTSMYFVPNLTSDCLLAYFHNDYDLNGLYRDFRRVMLKTSMGFRDYYVYIRKDIEKWLNSQLERIEKIDIRWQQEVYRMCEINRIEKPKWAYRHPKKLINSNSKNNGFTLYNVSEHLLRMSDNETSFYSIDGVVLKAKLIKWLHFHSYLTLTIESYRTLINYHRIIEDKSDIFEKDNISFNVTTAHGIIITCMQIAINEKTSSNSVISDRLNVKYNLDIVTPTGLKLEIRYDKPYIKQYYLKGSNVNDVSQEQFRLYLRNGTVVIFEKAGTINILYNNGSRVEIKKIIKMVLLIKHSEQQSAASNDVKKIDPGSNDTSKKSLKKIIDDRHVRINSDQSPESDNMKSNEAKKTDILNSGSNVESSKNIDDRYVRINSDENLKSDDTKSKVSKKTDSAALSLKKIEDGNVKKSLSEQTIQVEKYVLKDYEIFAWSGEYLHIVNNVIPRILYRHKMSAARDHSTETVVICKTDGTTSVYCKCSLKVLFPDGTLITTDIDDESSEQQTSYQQSDKEVKLEDNKQQGTESENSLKFPKLKIENKKTLAKFIEKLEEILIWYSNNDETQPANDDTDAESWKESFEFINAKYSVQNRFYAEIIYRDKQEDWLINFPGDILVNIGDTMNCILAEHTAIVINNKKLTILSNNGRTDGTVTRINLNVELEQDILCKCEDSIGRTITIKSDGVINYFCENENNKFSPKQNKLFNRFYVIKKDLNGYEFLRTDDVEPKLRRFNKQMNRSKPEIEQHPASVYTLNIFKKRTDSFQMSVDNPFRTNIITKGDLIEFPQKPEKWFFNLQPRNAEILATRIPKETRKLLAVLYIKIRNITTDINLVYEKLMNAFVKLDLIKQYFYDKYEKSTTLYCRQSKLELDKSYRSIYRYIGKASNIVKNKGNNKKELEMLLWD